jgi:hypothetical protein
MSCETYIEASGLEWLEKAIEQALTEARVEELDMRNRFYFVKKKSNGDRMLVCAAQWMKQELMLCNAETASPPVEIVKFDDVEFLEPMENTSRIAALKAGKGGGMK